MVWFGHFWIFLYCIIYNQTANPFIEVSFTKWIVWLLFVCVFLCAFISSSYFLSCLRIFLELEWKKKDRKMHFKVFIVKLFWFQTLIYTTFFFFLNSYLSIKETSFLVIHYETSSHFWRFSTNFSAFLCYTLD